MPPDNNGMDKSQRKKNGGSDGDSPKHSQKKQQNEHENIIMAIINVRAGAKWANMDIALNTIIFYSRMGQSIQLVTNRINTKPATI